MTSSYSHKLYDQKNASANGRTYLKRSTIGWQLCCQWEDGSTSWENLADLNSFSAKSVLAGEKLVATYSISM